MAKKRKPIKKEIKDKLLVDAMHRCCLCPQHEDLTTDFHHIVLFSENGPNTEENLMVVCPTCHAKIHRIRKMYNIEQLKMYKAKWISLCARGLTLEERLKEAPGIKLYLPPSLHNQTPPEENFVGREEELDTITEWYRSPEVRIGALIGWGGVGKSALVRKWYDSLEANNIKPDGIFWWGFYRNANLELFLNALLRYVSGGQIEPAEIKGTWEKIDRIKEYISRGAYLIILDGLEEMQKGEESGEQFGCMEHKECTEMLKYLADIKGNGLCLITTRYPLTDIEDYEGTTYQKIEVERLSIEDGRRLFEKTGVKGKLEEIDSVIEEYDGHALSLTLLAGYLAKDFGGDIKKAKEIPPFYSDKEAGGKAHRILLWYAKQLNEEQRAFMKIFSLFRRAVREEDFGGVFRAEMETEMNQALREMGEFAFRRMADNLVDRRLISKDKDGTYATHPLVKNYFDSIFEKEDKKLCHKRVYQYIGEYAPVRPETLDEMQPLFEQVYHGCAAGLYDKVFIDVYWKKIQRMGEGFLINRLGAWETELFIVRTFFPRGDISRVPLVSREGDKGFLLSEAGLTLLATGRPKEAEELLLKSMEFGIKERGGINAPAAYQNLADVRFRTGQLEVGVENAKKAVDSAKLISVDSVLWSSKAVLGWMFYLLGKSEEAEKVFKEADELCKKVEGNRMRCLWGISYADFLISTEKINEAFELTKENMKICRNILKDANNISRCHRCLGAIERIKGRYEEAVEHLQNAIEIVRKIGVTDIEIDVLLERGRLWLDMGKYEDAFGDAERVLKICGRTGFRFYEPEAEIVLGKAYLAQKKFEDAEKNAKSAYGKALEMKYRWAEGDAGHLLGEIYSAKGEKEQACSTSSGQAREWIRKAIKCRKEILDPKVKESESLLEKLG